MERLIPAAAETFGHAATIASSINKWSSGAPLARLLDSLGVTFHTVTVTHLGRVECEIDRADFDTVRRVTVNEYAATVHHEPGGVYVEARVDGVPVQIWAGVA